VPHTAINTVISSQETTMRTFRSTMTLLVILSVTMGLLSKEIFR
jgi:hypothetical protein